VLHRWNGLAASGVGQGMYVLAIPEQEYPPLGYAEIEAKKKARERRTLVE